MMQENETMDVDSKQWVQPLFMAYEKLKPFIDKDLRGLLSTPVKYVTRGACTGARLRIYARSPCARCSGAKWYGRA